MAPSNSIASDWLIASLEGVVADPTPDARMEALGEAAGLATDEVHRRLWSSGFVDRCLAGECDLDQMVAELRERLGADLTEAHLMGLWSLAYEPNLEAIASLTALPRVRVGVIADADPLLRAGFDAYLPEIEMMAAGSWFSCEGHALTDDVAFYRFVSEQAEFAGSPPALVAPTPAQQRAAVAAGWRTAPDLPSVH